jgi:hypothetical protein
MWNVIYSPADIVVLREILRPGDRFAGIAE